MVGTEGDDVLDVTDQQAVVAALGGNDRITTLPGVGGAGDDDVGGGPGVDIADFGDARHRMTINLGAGASAATAPTG